MTKKENKWQKKKINDKKRKYMKMAPYIFIFCPTDDEVVVVVKEESVDETIVNSVVICLHPPKPMNSHSRFSKISISLILTDSSWILSLDVRYGEKKLKIVQGLLREDS